MKKAIYFICYVLAFCVGILLLILNHHAATADNALLHNVFIGVGIVFVIPGISILLANLKPQKDLNSQHTSGSFLSGITGIIALIWGILILIMPSGMFGNLNITLGISIIILAIAQIIWIIKGKEINGAPLWLYIIPVLVAAAGVGILLIKKDYQNPGKELETGCIFAGIVLLFWAVNGFLSLPRRKKTEEDLIEEEKRLQRDKEKLEKGKDSKLITSDVKNDSTKVKDDNKTDLTEKKSKISVSNQPENK